MELLIFGIFMTIAFAMGYSFGTIAPQKAQKKENKPLNIVKNIFHKDNDDSFEYDEATKVMLENIDNYDGSGANQKDVPSEWGDDQWI